MEYNSGNRTDTLYRTAEPGDWLSEASYCVVHSEQQQQHRRIVSSASESDVVTSNLRERFQQTRISGSDGNLRKAHDQRFGSGWPNSTPDPGHEYKGCGLIGQMQRKWTSNIGNFGSKIYGLSSNIFSRDQGTQYKLRQNIGNDDFEVIEKHELVRLRLVAGNGCAGAAATTLMHGHRFVPANLKNPNWCDKCGSFIWGMSKYCYICINCRYTCHLKCREAVTLDCIVTADSNGSIEEEMSETCLDDDSTDEIDGDDDESGYFTCRSTTRRSFDQSFDQASLILSRDRLKKRIDQFNKNNHGLQMNLDIDRNTFQGCIRVHMNLIRPITMSVSPSPPSAYATLTHDTENNDTVRSNATPVMSFYLPRNTSKVIHVSSTTTAREVIKALLSKFNITDNPRKFALYDKNFSSRKTGVMRRMGEDELPLAVCLSWSDGGVDQLDNSAFVLHENDCGEILWEEFSLPELENFLGVLSREEGEHVEQVKDKYRCLRIQLQNELKQKEQDKALVTPGRRKPVFV